MCAVLNREMLLMMVNKARHTLLLMSIPRNKCENLFVGNHNVTWQNMRFAMYYETGNVFLPRVTITGYVFFTLCKDNRCVC